MANSEKPSSISSDVALETVKEPFDVDVPRTNKETRKIVTPYAFTVASELLGTPLASPMRRGTAIAIDVTLIFLLTFVSTIFFSTFVALTFFRQGTRLTHNHRYAVVQKILVGTGAIVIFFVAYTLLNALNEDNLETNTQNTVMGVNLDENDGVYLASLLIDQVCKEDLACFDESIEDLANGIASTTIPQQEVFERVTSMIDEKPWSIEDKAEITKTFETEYVNAKEVFIAENVVTEPSIQEPVQSSESSDAEVQLKTDKNTHSLSIKNGLVAFLEGVIADFGLSLGWAALYFSVLTAWWNGQTIGKKLMGIRVVKLNGKVPGLWESFGRYGGYAAGFATGLSGFLQLYWDANRQAIQDKISETLVIRINKK